MYVLYFVSNLNPKASPNFAMDVAASHEISCAVVTLNPKLRKLFAISVNGNWFARDPKCVVNFIEYGGTITFASSELI